MRAQGVRISASAPSWRRGSLLLVTFALLSIATRDAGAQPGAPAPRRAQGSVRVVGVDVLHRLYLSNHLDPLWTRERKPTPQALGVVSFLEHSGRLGLRPGDYDVAELREQLNALADADDPDAARAARLDVGLSQSLLRLLAHLRFGRHDPRDFGSNEFAANADEDLAAIALRASRSDDVGPIIGSVEPPYPGYQTLKLILERYRRLAADPGFGFPALGVNAIRPGDRHDGIPVLRRFLAATGDLPESADAIPDTSVYASDVVKGVTTFQDRHGLDTDGVLGRFTLAALRVPMTVRVAQIESSLERWRWLPRPLPSRFVVVNIPEFVLRAFEGPRQILSAAVIVGRASPTRRTPEFGGTIREVIAHPYWEVPPRIARNEVIPLIRRSTGYYEREGFEILRSSGDGPRRPPTGENLAGVATGALRLRQRPGPANPLGTLKFVFPNRFNVYLHDTNAKGLFARSRRDFSHGCVRVQDAGGLAKFVLGADDEWGRDIEAVLRLGKTQHRLVREPVEVFIMYATAAADERGARFLDDIYGRDAALRRAFTGTPGVIAAGGDVAATR